MVEKAEVPKLAAVTNNAASARSVMTATGPVVLASGAVHEDYFSDGEIKGMRATGLFEVEVARGKRADEAHRNAPKIGPHGLLRRGIPGAKDPKRKPAKMK